MVFLRLQARRLVTGGPFLLGTGGLFAAFGLFLRVGARTFGLPPAEFLLPLAFLCCRAFCVGPPALSLCRAVLLPGEAEVFPLSI